MWAASMNFPPLIAALIRHVCSAAICRPRLIKDVVVHRDSRCELFRSWMDAGMWANARACLWATGWACSLMSLLGRMMGLSRGRGTSAAMRGTAALSALKRSRQGITRRLMTSSSQMMMKYRWPVLQSLSSLSNISLTPGKGCEFSTVYGNL